MKVETTRDIQIGTFENEQIQVKTQKGRVSIRKCYSRAISLESREGSIDSKGVLQAEKITLKTSEGNISTERLQGVHLQVETQTGNIDISSTYSREGLLSSKCGNITIKNAHGNNRITLQNATLKVSGLNGSANASIENGNVEMQISKVTSPMEISVREGDVSLTLSKECQKETVVHLESPNCFVESGVHLNDKRFSQGLSGENEGRVKLSVLCKKGRISVKNGDWSDSIRKMFGNVSK